ncbi:hypothetical protein [Acinetobacter baumannii]|uniref:hypothetical protein n=1 Tax=Acinetobacter baumannii TaxID=470 RepID=UPI0029403AC4|nr:hypothetical protein [Acinetobacter baumannii]MDV4239038.1 hypothetical protein [Acinetobacter baumannii]HCA5022615.1 hypothetical protein [Acinetobacter baumannii]
MNIKTLVVKAHVRYWDDSEINNVPDTENGANVPCKIGDIWSPKIDVATGIIENWELGKRAFIHYKVCDCCGFELLDDKNNIVISRDDGYVPKTLSPAKNGYGDYIIMCIDSVGQIINWKFNLEDFQDEDES